MNKFRQCENDRLTELTILARDAKKTNTKYVRDLSSVLRLADICRKYETEKEKVCTVYDIHRLNTHGEQVSDDFI